MVKGGEEKKVEMIESKEQDEDIFDLDRKLSAKENRTTNSNPIYSRRRNTLNILKAENQNFLNTLSKSAKPFVENDLFITQINKTNDSVARELFKSTNSSDRVKSGDSRLVDAVVDGPSDRPVERDRYDESIRKSDSRSDSSMRYSELPDEMLDSKRSKQSPAGLSESSVVQTDRQLTSIIDHDADSIEEEDFLIPHLPEGKVLRIVLKSNWGDDNWIGLNGIEVFDSRTFKSLTATNVGVFQKTLEMK